jgi:phospholipid/cholesterol/gamma-HCH transport system permease protein
MAERPAPVEAAPPLDREVAARLVAATLTGPVMGLWGAVVGTLIGWQVAKNLLGVSTHTFFLMFSDLIWLRDVIGLIIKGLAFGLLSGLFACHEGVRPSNADGPGATANAACRAACFSALSVLLINSGWFLLVYHAGPAFGPTLMAPPSS